MERFISRHSEISNDNKAIEQIQREYGSDGLKMKKEEYGLNLYPEFIPTLNSWVAMDEQRERLEEILGDNEELTK